MSRALRRHHRQRLIATRFRKWVAMRTSWASSPHRGPLGKLANEQAYLGCPSGRHCGVCHPEANYGRRAREKRTWRVQEGL